MISQEQIPSVVDHPIYDPDGKKIGEARHVFLDERTGEPEWATVRTGLFGTQETFVPIHDGRIAGDHVEVPVSRTKVRDAPHMDVSKGRLTEQQERELYSFYGFDFDAPQTQVRGGDGGGLAGETGTGADAGAGAGMGAAGLAAGTGAGAAGAGAPGAGAAGAPGKWGTEDREAGLGTSAGTGTAAGKDAMTRSEEYLRVGTERYESGRARLVKYVDTEQVEQTVPVHHEEVRVEREPITEANAPDAMSGPKIAEDAYEVTLHDERPVVDTEAVPVERVRLVTEDHIEQKTVRGTVRRERVELEREDERAPEGKRERRKDEERRKGEAA